MGSPSNDVGTVTAPAWGITWAGAVALLRLRCQRCERVTLTIHSTLPVVARTFLKSYLTGGKTPALPDDVLILCPDCEVANGNANEVPKL